MDFGAAAGGGDGAGCCAHTTGATRHAAMEAINAMRTGFCVMGSLQFCGQESHCARREATIGRDNLDRPYGMSTRLISLRIRRNRMYPDANSVRYRLA